MYCATASADRVGDDRRVDPAGDRGPGDVGHRARLGRVGDRPEPLGHVAQRLVDPRAHEARAEHRDVHVGAGEGELVEEGLAEAHDRELGRAVRAHVGHAEEPGQRRGVDDVALVLVEEVRHEGVDPVDDALRFTPTTHSHIASGVPIAAPPPTPALLNTRCAAPNSASAASRRATTSASTATSQPTPTTRAPAERSDDTASSSGPASMSPSTRLAPSAANRRAVASPIPLAPPVMTAVLPARSMDPPRVRARR